MRDKSIDVGRGILTLLMVYCHVLQFFADGGLFPETAQYMEAINLTVFQTFVFYFGATAVLAYLRKPYLKALPGMANTALRSYGAFVLSGIAFRVLRENVPFAVGTVRRVLQLTDIPGWSEFLISFTGYALLLIVLFPVLRKLAEKPLWALLVAVVCAVASQNIPYDEVTSVPLALVIGGRQFSYFPVLHYMPFFLAGMVYASGGKKLRIGMGILAAACAVAGIVYRVNNGLPERFPPSIWWLAIGVAPTLLVVLAGKGLALLYRTPCTKIADLFCNFFAHFGSRSLYYLLGSNLVIFTMAGKGMVPVMARKSVIPWTTPIQSPAGAAVWTAVLFAALWFVAILAGRGGAKKKTTQK